jgi:superfamily II DNA/RNA helicase
VIDKIEVLCKTAKRAENCEKVIIFGRTKRGVEVLSKESLREKVFKAESIHGDKNHSQRQRASEELSRTDEIINLSCYRCGRTRIGYSKCNSRYQLRYSTNLR